MVAIASFFWIVARWVAPLVAGEWTTLALTTLAAIVILDNNSRNYLVATVGLNPDWQLPFPQEPRLVYAAFKLLIFF